MTIGEAYNALKQRSPNTKAVVISGGEPMLQQRELTSLLVSLKGDGYWVEVETNGTIAPTPTFAHLVDQFNCSPKLSNSGPDNPLSKREVPEALITLASLSQTTFKFVVVTDEDLREVLDLVRKYKMKQVWLMPEGKTRSEQLERQEQVKVLCDRFGFHFSPRLHILEHGDKRGV